MNIEQFANALKEELWQRIKEKGGSEESDRHLEYYVIHKNNGVQYHGLLIKQKAEPVVPYICVEQYLEDYRRGKTLEAIAEEIEYCWNSHLETVRERNMNFSYESIKGHIVFRMVHYGRNEALLKDVPHIRLLDLAITFHVVMIQEETEIGMFLIRNEHLGYWGVTEEEIHKLAMENTPGLFPGTIASMQELLGLEQDETPMYIISNETGINGAGAILYPMMLSNLSERLRASLYLLPSSIHEFIAIPFQRNYEVNLLRKIVKEVNDSQVPEEDYLSDKVYYYDKEKKVILYAHS